MSDLDILCQQCVYLTYDEEYDEYVCDVQMDEDDYYRLSQSKYQSCPYYQNADDYLLARKQ